MKKILSIILSLTLLMSMSVTAFAENVTSGSQTVSVSVPTPCYDYTLHIPTVNKIEYNVTEPQYIGTVTVTSDYWDNITTDYLGVLVECSSNEYLSNKNGTEQIYCMIGNVGPNSIFEPFPSNQFTWGFKADGAEQSGLSKMYMKVHDWSNAKPGESYSVTITYTSWLAERH